jgi:hypothetical protein
MRIKEVSLFYLVSILAGSYSISSVISDAFERPNFENGLTLTLLTLTLLVVYISIYKAMHFDLPFLRSITPEHRIKTFKFIKILSANLFWIFLFLIQQFHFKSKMELAYFPTLALLGTFFAEVYYQIIIQKKQPKNFENQPRSWSSLFIFESIITKKTRLISWAAYLLFLIAIGLPFILCITVLSNISHQQSPVYTLFPLIFLILILHGLLFCRDRPDHHFIRSLNNKYKHIIAQSESNIFTLLLALMSLLHLAIVWLITGKINLRLEIYTIATCLILSKVLFYKASYLRELSFKKVFQRIFLYLIFFIPILFFI